VYRAEVIPGKKENSFVVSQFHQISGTFIDDDVFLVIIFWDGISIVIVRSLTICILSRIGIRMISPGPLTPVHFPRKKITPRSYSWTILTLMKNRTMPIRIRIIKKSIVS
jgi:hypothetical protein